MRATELFTDVPDWQPEDDELGPIEEELGEDMSTPVAGLRILEIEDHDASADAIDAMESGEIQQLSSSSSDEIESLLVNPEADYSVRLALVDASAGQADAAINRAILNDVDLIVVGPWDDSTAQSHAELQKRLVEAARTGTGVFTIRPS